MKEAVNVFILRQFKIISESKVVSNKRRVMNSRMQLENPRNREYHIFKTDHLKICVKLFWMRNSRPLQAITHLFWYIPILVLCCMHRQCYCTSKTRLLKDELDCIYEVFINFQYNLLGNMTNFQNVSFLTHRSSEFSFQMYSWVSYFPNPRARSLDLYF